MIGHSVKRHLPVPLTPEEVRERLEQSAVMIGEIEKQEIDAKAKAKADKEAIETLRAQLSQLSREARDREAFKDVTCRWEPHYDRGEAVLKRTDTGEVIDRRGLSEQELQTHLPVFEPSGESEPIVEITDLPPVTQLPSSPRRRTPKGTDA